MRGGKRTLAFDRSVILGNRTKINVAIQDLNAALQSLNHLDNEKSKRNADKVRKALELLIQYNVENVKLGHF